MVSTFRINANEDFFLFVLNSSPTEGLMERAGWGWEEEEGGDKHLWFVCFFSPYAEMF